jgi:hypothetical protein
MVWNLKTCGLRGWSNSHECFHSQTSCPVLRQNVGGDSCPNLEWLGWKIPLQLDLQICRGFLVLYKLLSCTINYVQP